jgi:hypothetical protein
VTSVGVVAACGPGLMVAGSALAAFGAATLWAVVRRARHTGKWRPVIVPVLAVTLAMGLAGSLVLGARGLGPALAPWQTDMLPDRCVATAR